MAHLSLPLNCLAQQSSQPSGSYSLFIGCSAARRGEAGLQHYFGEDEEARVRARASQVIFKVT